MEIPRIIHYVWFGSQKPNYVKEVIKSWGKKAPEFQIKEWGERELSDLYQTNTFFRAALIDKNYSYASDVARLYILKKYGGIYMDTDEMLLSDPSKILQNKELVFGMQEPKKEYMSMAFIASVPNQTDIVKQLDLYDSLNYNKSNLTPNSEFMGPLLFERFKIKHVPKTQSKKNGKIIFYAPNVLYQPSFSSVAIHIGMKSWGKKIRHDKFRIQARKHIKNRFEAGVFRIFNDIARRLIPDTK